MSNLAFKHDVNDHATAKALYEQGNTALCYNTHLRKSGTDFQVVHWSTPIVTFHEDGSATINGAVVSSTTANRLHHYKPLTVDRINRREVVNGRRVPRYIVSLKAHPGEFDVWEGERYRIFPDYTVVKV